MVLVYVVYNLLGDGEGADGQTGRGEKLIFCSSAALLPCCCAPQSPTFSIFTLLWQLRHDELLPLLGQTAQTDNQHREDQGLLLGDTVQKTRAGTCDVTQQRWSRLN